MGTTCLIHRHPKTKPEPDKYPTCEETITAKHIICYCQNYRNIRVNHDLSDNVQEVLTLIHQLSTKYKSRQIVPLNLR